MKILPIFVFLATILNLSTAFAYEAEISFYVFTNHGKSSAGKVNMVENLTVIPVSADWFGWKCTAQKQVDGALLNCTRNDEVVETKIYCGEKNDKASGRLVRVGKAGSFVSFEVRCGHPEPVKAPTTKKRTPKKALPPKEKPQEKNNENATEPTDKPDKPDEPTAPPLSVLPAKPGPQPVQQAPPPQTPAVQ
jgi:hypothetical protein